MSSTWRETSPTNGFHKSNLDSPATIPLESNGEIVHHLPELPPTIFPCLDARPGLGKGWQCCEISFNDIDVFRAYCSQYNVSSLAVLQAAWALVLRCYTGNLSPCFACEVCEEATHAALSSPPNAMSKFCIADIGSEMRVLELLKGMSMNPYKPSSQSLEARSFPTLQPSPSAVLPVNTLLFFRDKQEQDWLDDERLEPEDWAGNDILKPQIVIDIAISQKAILATLNYLPSTLSVISAQNVASTYVQGIQEILKHPARVVKDISLFSPRDLRHLKLWNHSFPLKVNACVHDLVLEHTRTSPQAPAVSSWDGDLTYQDLNRMSHQLATELVEAGVQHEMLVPVCFRKSFSAVVAMVAIHRAGGAFVPLDPSHPKDRLKAIIDKTNAKIIVTSPETAQIFHDTPVSVVQVSSSSLKSTELSLDNLLPKVQPDQAAFVLFTSGSTGTPKGIVQEHASVCTSSLAHGRAMYVSSSSRVFQYAAFTFDVSMMDIFTTLIHGGCVCIPSEEDRMGSFIPVMNRMRVNWVLFTPSVASLFNPEDVPTLQTLVYGGEAVKQENVSRWVGKVRLFNCYGPAECGACAIGEFTRSDARPSTCGRHFGGELCWVVDPDNHDRLLPVGATGELAVEGPTLARGYLDDLLKTQAAFIKSPAWPTGTGSSDEPRRIYKTGDLVRQNSDGTFDFVGRKDLQVKVRGQRVEIGEVEHHLSTYPGVALSIVAIPQSGPYAQTLVGILQLASPLDSSNGEPASSGIDHLSRAQILASDFDRGRLFGFLNSKLPPYMVPTHLLPVTKLPLSVSGKIDRRMVDTWLSRTSRPTEPMISTAPSQRFLAGDDMVALDICSKVLLMASTPGDSFFKSLDRTDFLLAAVGLDSIKMINLIMFIRQRFGVKIHLDVLMDPMASIKTIAGAVAEIVQDSLKTNVGSQMPFMKVIQEYKQQSFKWTAEGGVMSTNVLLTGGTGFLGSRILRQLCQNPDVQRVLVHVRSQDTRKALQRIVLSATLAGWWKEEYLRKIEAWAGDLGKPKLGIKPEQWDRLCGRGSPQDRVTAIIHNGAKVNWNASLPALKRTNVDSTGDLLNAASLSTALTNFVFVSGGQQLRIEADQGCDVAEEVSQSNGYAQSKFLSELMVQDYAQTVARRQQQVSIVKPGYIIGSVDDGICVAHDYIWRLAVSCAAIGAYNADDADAFLFVADVDRVATAVADCCDSQKQHTLVHGSEIVKILDGLPVRRFWNLVSRGVGIEVRPLTAEAWMNRLFTNIETAGEQHPLWPLIQTVEKGQGRLGIVCKPLMERIHDDRRVEAAVTRSIEYLDSVGYWSRFKEEGKGPKQQKEKDVPLSPPQVLA
ncbi:MAG: hypothetical protein L6R37_002588 [Teloschistes peruensis]|nr:MAG: hypothetical protein L6R37_002588 [Teloschistes peruensis]